MNEQLIVQKDPYCTKLITTDGGIVLDVEIGSIKSHKLQELAKKVEKYYKLSFDAAEYEFLERLAKFVTEDGRYPVATKRSKQRGLHYSPNDKVTFEGIWDRIWPVLKKIVDAREVKTNE